MEITTEDVTSANVQWGVINPDEVQSLDDGTEVYGIILKPYVKVIHGKIKVGNDGYRWVKTEKPGQNASSVRDAFFTPDTFAYLTISEKDAKAIKKSLIANTERKYFVNGDGGMNREQKPDTMNAKTRQAGQPFADNKKKKQNTKNNNPNSVLNRNKRKFGGDR